MASQSLGILLWVVLMLLAIPYVPVPGIRASNP